MNHLKRLLTLLTGFIFFFLSLNWELEIVGFLFVVNAHNERWCSHQRVMISLWEFVIRVIWISLQVLLLLWPVLRMRHKKVSWRLIESCLFSHILFVCLHENVFVFVYVLFVLDVAREEGGSFDDKFTGTSLRVLSCWFTLIWGPLPLLLFDWTFVFWIDPGFCHFLTRPFLTIHYFFLVHWCA